VISRPFGKGNNAEADINLLEKRFLDDLEHMFEGIPKNIRWFHQKVGRAVMIPALTLSNLIEKKRMNLRVMHAKNGFHQHTALFIFFREGRFHCCGVFLPARYSS
jgi:hypothetical protein